MKCPDCDIEMKKIDTNYPCPYCIEHDNCICESMDIIGACSGSNVYECNVCGYTEID